MHSLDDTVSDKIVIYVLSHVDIGQVKEVVQCVCRLVIELGCRFPRDAVVDT